MFRMRSSAGRYSTASPWAEVTQSADMQSDKIKGTVLRIERSSIHDGEGLRTVLFLKGCPLDCQWCSTPESQSSRLELGIAQERCDGCRACIPICPEGALSLKGGSLICADDLCTGCFKCVDRCPTRALKGFGSRMTAAQAVEEISKDEIFFFHSGGGVTLSGGECLVQADFTAAVLRLCRERGISTAVETSLYAPWKNIEKIIPYVNDFYVDLKHPDRDAHQQYVGADNELILENLEKLCSSQTPFQIKIRIPLIPGVNDSDAELAGSVSIAQKCSKLSEIELLPYHRLGMGTYALLGRPYLLADIATPAAEYIIERAEFVKTLQPGVPVKTGGGYL